MMAFQILFINISLWRDIRIFSLITCSTNYIIVIKSIGILNSFSHFVSLSCIYNGSVTMSPVYLTALRYSIFCLSLYVIPLSLLPLSCIPFIGVFIQLRKCFISQLWICFYKDTGIQVPTGTSWGHFSWLQQRKLPAWHQTLAPSGGDIEENWASSGIICPLMFIITFSILLVAIISRCRHCALWRCGNHRRRLLWEFH